MTLCLWKWFNDLRAQGLSEISSPPTLFVENGMHSLPLLVQSPALLHHNGRLIGYYVGYKRYNSSTPYLYVTVPAAAAAHDNTTTSLRCQLDGLSKYTLYGVHVQAYNAKGAGPRSADYVVMTLEDGTTQNFSAHATTTTASTISTRKLSLIQRWAVI